MQQDCLRLINMVFHAYHGVMPEEQVLGQKFAVDLEMVLPLQEAGWHDDLQLTVNYAAVYATVRQLVETRQFRLIETLAETIAREVLDNYKVVQEVTVRVRKPQVPIGGFLDYAEVEIKRGREKV